MGWIRQCLGRRRIYEDLAREFGNITLIEEESREVWQWPALEALFQDARHSLRLMRKSPGFTGVAVVSLALGIGANAALFSLVDSLVMRDLPVAHPEELVRIAAAAPDDPEPGLSLAMYEEIGRNQKVFSEMFAWLGDAVLNVEANRELSHADIWAASGNFYSALGASPEIGRLIEPKDANLQVAVLGYGFWQRHYGGARDVIGKTVKIEGALFTIIGVTRKGFTGMAPVILAEITIPLTAWPPLFGERSDSLWMQAAGRLKPGVTLDRARAQVQSLWPSIRDLLTPVGKTPLELSRFRSLQIQIEAGRKSGRFLTGFVKPVYVLLGIAGMVLLIACANLASLLLARVAARNYEMGVRVALGASRGRLARQMIVESVMLSLASAIPAFGFALWAARGLSASIFAEFFTVPAELNLSPDWRMLFFICAAVLASSILFGWAPAWRAAREDPQRAVQGNARTLARNTGRLGKALIVTQVAMSLVLLMCAGLFIRSLQQLRANNPGFRIHGLLQAGLVPKPGGYKNVALATYYRALNERLAQIPGVRSAAFIHVQLGNVLEWDEQFRVAGSDSQARSADVEMVMPGAFDTLGITLQRGRTFTWRDDERSHRIAVVSQSFASQFIHAGDAVGKRFDVVSSPKWQNIEIVGIVSDASLYNVRQSHTPTVYLPTLQYGDYAGYPRLVVETDLTPAGIGDPLRRVVDSFGYEYVDRIKTVRQSIERSLWRERMTALLSTFFGALALMLAFIGLYGLLAYNVSRRSREIGIRMALGAQRRSVEWMVLRETLLLVAAGLAIGFACAAAATRLIEGMLYGVGRNDPVTAASVSFLLMLVAGLAAFVPARRATRLDPAGTLHQE